MNPTKKAVCGDMGVRAAELLLKGDKLISVQLREMGLGHNLFNNWNNGECAPSAYVLRTMALAGYDVMYILTGKRSKEVRHGNQML